MRVEVFGAGDERMALAIAVRRVVFMEEQGIAQELEIDEHDTVDPGAVHAVSFVGDQPVATGRFYENPDGSVQIGRMATLPAQRGRGVGGAVLAALLEEAKRRGYRRACLDAQLPAAGLYRRHGFADAGDRHWDAGIYHQPMTAKLG